MASVTPESPIQILTIFNKLSSSRFELVEVVQRPSSISLNSVLDHQICDTDKGPRSKYFECFQVHCL